MRAHLNNGDLQKTVSWHDLDKVRKIAVNNGFLLSYQLYLGRQMFEHRTAP